jgi:hypothetical protein
MVDLPVDHNRGRVDVELRHLRGDDVALGLHHPLVQLALEAPRRPGHIGERLEIAAEEGQPARIANEQDAVVAVHSRDEHFPPQQRAHGSEARIAGGRFARQETRTRQRNFHTTPLPSRNDSGCVRLFGVPIRSDQASKENSRVFQADLPGLPIEEGGASSL